MLLFDRKTGSHDLGSVFCSTERSGSGSFSSLSSHVVKNLWTGVGEAPRVQNL